MAMVSSEARSRIHSSGRTIRRIRQEGVPFEVPVGVPVVNPFAEKRLLFRARYRLSGVGVADVCEGLLFGDYGSFMDMKLDTFSRRRRTRHFKMNPFKIKMGETGRRLFGNAGMRRGHDLADFMVARLGLVEWEVSEESRTGPDTAVMRVKLTSKYFGGHFRLRVYREGNDVVLDDDWMPEDGGDVRTPSFLIGNLVLMTHPLGFEQLAERVVEEIIQARDRGEPYAGQVGPPSEEVP